MRRYRIVLTLTAMALLSSALRAKPDGVRVFDTENGLPHNRVNRIYADSKGFLWICTDDGLARFDGHHWVSYTTANGLPHKYVNAVLESRNGDFWVATDGGLSRFDPRPGHTRFTNYAPPGPADASHINALVEDSDGSLLAGASLGLYRFKAKDPRPIFEHVELGSAADPAGRVMVNAIARAADNSLWLGASDGLYRCLGNAGCAHYGTDDGLAIDRRIGAKTFAYVTSFAEDATRRLWVTFKGGFGRLVTAPKPGAPVLDFVQRSQPGLGREIRALWFGSDGRRWIATESGLLEWISDADGISRFREHAIDKFPQEAFLSLHEDLAGNLWVGTRRSGLLQVGSSKFQTFSDDEGLRLGSDQVLVAMRSGQLSVFDLQTHLYQWDGGRFVVIRPALPEPGASTPHWQQTAMEDHKGAWWFSNSSGLFRFPDPRGRFDVRLLPGSAVGRMFEDSVGDIWMSHWPAGAGAAKLARWERRSGLVHDESERLPLDARMGIAAFAQDHTGAIWIGLHRPGSALLRLKDGRFRPISAKWTGHINTLFVDARGRVWATSTESGLGLINDPQSLDPELRRYTRKQGLSTDEVWCVTEDRFGRIYIGTAKGLDRLEPETDKIVHYSSADGLVRGDIRSSLQDRNGDLWFASAHGVSRLRPSEDHAHPQSRARITGVRAGGVPLPISELGEKDVGPVQVSSHQNSLQVDFAATDFRTQAPLQYQFRLNNQSDADETSAWQDSGTNSTVHLMNVAPGHFIFRVRAITPDNVPGDPASLAFSVLQPVWQTWWFQLACVMAVASFAWWIRIRSLQQQLAVERVRSQIAMDLHDDVGAGLSKISVIAEVLNSRLRAGDHNLQEMLGEIAHSSRQLITDMSDIVWSLDPTRDHVEDLASRLRAFGSDLLEMRGLEWTVDSPEGSLHQSLPPALRRQLYLVFREGIHNVARHSGAKRANLRLWLEDGQVWGELTDDGCGIAPSGKLGNGIPGMRERVKRLGGDIAIRTSADRGTSIRIHVPLSTNA